MDLTKRPRQAPASSGPLKIAVTGSAGSGKSSVCECLRQKGLRVVSSDRLARDAMAPGTIAYREIIKHFGNEVIAADGTLNRRWLRQLIVDDRHARQRLEALVHPEVVGLIQSAIREAEKKKEAVIVVEIPLLFEISMEDRFDVVLLVVAEREQQIHRIMQRDRVSRNGAEALLNAQMPNDTKIAKSDYVIYNQGVIEKITTAVDCFFEKFCKKNKKCPKMLDSVGIM